QVFELVGYINPTAEIALPVQPETAVFAIRIFMSIVPAVLLLAAIAFAWKYPLTREKHLSLLEQLDIN
ncbi:MAG: hypothetical protein KC421_02565, partial [Anaerolineales bacterium]|nr:hypothetical protein [Anaerolineales bacterium]